MTVGNRIKEVRKSLKLTQNDLAKRINVSSQVISNWERGYTTPDSDDISNLAKALSITTDYLHGLSDDPTPTKTIKHSEPYNSLEEINKLVKEFNIEQLGFFDIEKWKNFTPEDIDELRRHFEWVAQKAKERNEEKD